MEGTIFKLVATAGVTTFVSVLGGIVTPSTAHAATVTNPGFETSNFNGWITTGETNVVGSGIGTSPVEGNFQAALSTAGTISDSALEAFLGLPTGSLDGLGNGNATAGSAIKQTITVAAGEILTFSYNFLTNEATPSFFNDFGFFSVSGVNQAIQELADTGANFVSTLTNFNEETGYQPVSYTFANAGTYTIGFGVVDSQDTVVDSALLVDNISTTEVPTPALIPGLIGMGVAAFSKKRKAPAEEA